MPNTLKVFGILLYGGSVTSDTPQALNYHFKFHKLIAPF
jgi:hypothetical protein